MAGASISRWTMSYFAASLVFLVVGQALLAGGFGYPVLPVEAPETLVIVHSLAVGWLALLFCGALLQFVPVLAAAPLFLPGLAAPALVLLVIGLALLNCGFLNLAGYVDHGLVLLPIGAALLATGFGLIVTMIGGTLARTGSLSLPARFVALGLLALTAAAGLGVAFALELSGLVDVETLHGLLPAGVSLHAYFGMVGWMSVSAFGVSYRLLTMFLLSPETERATTCSALALVVLSVAVASITLMALALGSSRAEPVYLPFVLAAGAGLIFGYDVLTIFRARKRKALELNSITSALAVAFLMLAILLYLLLLFTGQIEDRIGALVYLVCFGWLSLLGLGQLYKIVAFLTWLECYGPVLGRTPVPRVQELVCDGRASNWFYLYTAAVCVAVVALLLEGSFVFRGAVLAQTVAVIGLTVEFVRTRRLFYVSVQDSKLDAQRHPSLFLPNSIERS
ncbi:hypothetical protein [Pseudorhizobium pelagicum]|uniref:Transmembrane protein n=1 Tax=Pseudorhizobium pelagicum TaxID=1509405 RepID=A0A922T7S8_9HYPH|nr:hypothetical protein [Pseudorhizobium pelagicum]KEQ03050.1 hypothetical protein GV67_16260 [Pseudorhizobium pelagicum]KEQ09002.1 hypothetical protein GV68_24810 [Pseudorhizobium pelagicum]